MADSRKPSESETYGFGTGPPERREPALAGRVRGAAGTLLGRFQRRTGKRGLREAIRSVDTRDTVAVWEYGDGPVADEYEALVSLCLAFDANSRADGLPPELEPRVRWWLDIILRGYCLVAWDGIGAVGVVVLLPDGERGHELAVYVHPGYHRRGVGRRLVETALSVAEAANIERVELITMGDNYGMIALALGQGFEVTRVAAGQIEMDVTLPLEH